ncbi:uncharacterized protein LOC131030543 isoform X2 [Cryptomeria japonica]|uniref:uncharacterized protein LOC131030543 isoform X2 n=1 Tax=Cryptomeria japonica TaxID=3369 RepID=UPI0025AC3EA8|nr:uncharacterized protein LOC131030543 isoform X2 [Cryptomeria japonica]
MSCIVSFNDGLLLCKRQSIKSLGIGPLTYRCTKPSNTNNKFFNTNDSCLHLSKKKILHRRFPVIRASKQLAESIEHEIEKYISTGKFLEFKHRADFHLLRDNGIDGVDLQTAIVTYQKKLPGSILQPGLQVALVSCLHHADKEFYADLQQELDNYDRVLYEGIIFKDPIKQSNRNPETRLKLKNYIKFHPSPFFLIAYFLGLYDHSSCLDYGRDNWYNADLDYHTYNRMRREAKENCTDSILEEQTSDKSSEAIPLSAFDESHPMKTSLTNVCKLFYADFIASRLDADGLIYSVDIEERNKVVMEELRAAMNDGCNKIAVLYGSGHMADLDRRLQAELDLVPTQISWKTAWAIRNQSNLQKELLCFSILAVLVVLAVRLFSLIPVVLVALGVLVVFLL